MLHGSETCTRSPGLRARNSSLRFAYIPGTEYPGYEYGVCIGVALDVRQFAARLPRAS